MFCDTVLSAWLAIITLVSTVMMATLVVGLFYLSDALGLEAALAGLTMSAGPLVGYVAPLVVVTAGHVMFQAANNTAVMLDVHPAPVPRMRLRSAMLRPTRHAQPTTIRRRLAIQLRRAVLLLLAMPLLAILLFRVVPPPLTPLMLIRSLEGHQLRKNWVAYPDIAPALAHAVIAAEDNLFCQQMLGFDFDALGEQITAWWRGDRPRGASTITMQTAKNLFLWPGRDPARKLLEAWLTPQIALLWPKRRILEVYLNVVEFGPGIYGAEAAARAFYGKPASALSRGEAARLAAVLPSPLTWSVERPSASVRQRSATIERRIGQLGPLLACAG